MTLSDKTLEKKPGKIKASAWVRPLEQQEGGRMICWGAELEKEEAGQEEREEEEAFVSQQMARRRETIWTR